MKDALGSVQSVLVLGGGSDIARATCEALVRRRHARVVLAARKPEALDPAVAVTAITGWGFAVGTDRAFDATDFATHQDFVTSTFDRFGDFDVVLNKRWCSATRPLAEPSARPSRSSEPTSPGSCPSRSPVSSAARTAGPRFARAVVERRGRGVPAVIELRIRPRRRPVRRVLTQGLGDSLARPRAYVMIVRPGFVTTKMTEGLEPAPLSTTPKRSRAGDRAGTRAGRDTVWVPPTLRYVIIGAAAPAATSVPAPPPEVPPWRSCGERHGRRPLCLTSRDPTMRMEDAENAPRPKAPLAQADQTQRGWRLRRARHGRRPLSGRSDRDAHRRGVRLRQHPHATTLLPSSRRRVARLAVRGGRRASFFFRPRLRGDRDMAKARSLARLLTGRPCGRQQARRREYGVSRAKTSRRARARLEWHRACTRDRVIGRVARCLPRRSGVSRRGCRAGAPSSRSTQRARAPAGCSAGTAAVPRGAACARTCRATTSRSGRMATRRRHRTAGDGRSPDSVECALQMSLPAMPTA